MLESIFKGVLNISLYATVVAVVITLIKVIYGKRLSPDFHYGITGKKYSFIAGFVAIVVVLTAGVVLLTGEESGNANSDKGFLLSQIDEPQNSNDIDFTNGWKSNLIENERYIIVEVGFFKKRF